MSTKSTHPSAQPTPKDVNNADTNADTREWTGPTAAKFESKAHSQFFDPCQSFADKSIRCLNRNAGDREMCGDFFQAYRECKEQWTNARREARRGKGWFG